jgi:Flp pilus assembly protein TadB
VRPSIKQTNQHDDGGRAQLQTRFNELRSAEERSRAKKEELREQERAAARVDANAFAPTLEDRLKMKELFQKEKKILVADAIFISLLGLCFTWYIGTLSTALSYSIGAAIGIGYVVLLAQYAASFETGGSGASSGRFALVFFLVLLAGKNRDTLDILPMLLGFFTYQFAALAQAVKAIGRNAA